MGMSKQTTFTLTFLVGLSVLVPGSAGYLSARMDAVQRTYRDLVSLESRLREERLLAPVQDVPQIQTIAVPAMPCEVLPPSHPRRRKAPMPAALIPVPVEALPAEPPPAGPTSAEPRPTEGLRFEPLPPEPRPAGPEAAEPRGSETWGRPPSAEQRRGRGRREPQEQLVISEQSMSEERSPLEDRRVSGEGAPPLSGPFRRIPTGTGPDQAELPAN